MHAFVDAILRRIPDVRESADIDLLLGHLAEHLGYRGAFLVVFPQDRSLATRLWDSDRNRSIWWHGDPEGALISSVRAATDRMALSGIHFVEISPDEASYPYAATYDFTTVTVVPVTFDTQLRGMVCFTGERMDHTDFEVALEIVCYSLLVQANYLASSSRPHVALTPREHQVMELSAAGLTSEMVANELGMSPRTVNQHVDNVSSKLNARNRVHAVAEAMRRGLLR